MVLKIPPVARHVVEVFTARLRVRGTLVITPARRLSDALNDEAYQFLHLEAVTLRPLETDACDHVVEAETLTLNKAHITLVFPIQENEVLQMRRDIVRRFELIPKRPHPVVIETPQFVVRGNIHLIEEVRLKDALDALREAFVAITEATVAWADRPQDILAQCPFVSVNKDQIVALYPGDAAEAPGATGE